MTNSCCCKLNEYKTLSTTDLPQTAIQRLEPVAKGATTGREQQSRVSITCDIVKTLLIIQCRVIIPSFYLEVKMQYLDLKTCHEFVKNSRPCLSCPHML